VGGGKCKWRGRGGETGLGGGWGPSKLGLLGVETVGVEVPVSNTEQLLIYEGVRVWGRQNKHQG